MIAQLRAVSVLVRRPWKGWMLTSVFGSLLIAGLDMVGVAAMLPLMQVVTGADRTSGSLGALSNVIRTSEPQALLLTLALLVGLAFIVKSAVTILYRWWLLGHTTALEAEAATELMRRYVLAPYATHRGRKLAEVHRNIAGAVPQTFSQVVLGILSLTADALTVVALALVLLFVSPAATIVAVGFFTAVGWGTQQLLKKRHHRIGEALAASDLDAWSALMPGINGFRESRLAAAGQMFVGRFRKAKLERARASRELSLVSELPKYVLEIGFVGAIAAVASFLFATGTPEEALAVIGVFAAGSLRILPTVNRLVATFGVIRAGQVGLRILTDEVQSLSGYATHAEDPTAPRAFRGDIVLDNVEFRFPDSTEPTLRGLTLTIEQGRTTAFVGSSGAGKSTLLDIVLGLLEPTAGSVRCGGVDIRTDLAGWYAGLGVVPQDVFLLDDSLENNIAFGETGTVDAERLARAISMAQLDGLVAELPDGLETHLGERGVRLSGGQRQRVGIARALYRRPDVLVLDEATSALDNVTEHRLTETLDALRGSITIVVVAHRLSTVRNADKIVYMADGRIEAEGTFDQVTQESRGFAELVSLGRLV